jgi:hypothetical protein
MTMNVDLKALAGPERDYGMVLTGSLDELMLEIDGPTARRADILAARTA